MTVDGEVFRYSTIWQRRNLLLVLADADADRADVAELTARGAAFRERNGECIVTHDRVNGFPDRGVVVADRWGEIVHIAAVPAGAGLPSSQELLDWLDYVESRCPECEGEAR
jgi:hypothetical protein